MIPQVLAKVGLPLAGVILAFVAGYYSKECPPPVPCEKAIQMKPVEKDVVVAQPETQAADAQFTDREKALNATIAQLRAEAKAKPRVITRTRTVTQKVSVPQACQQYVPKACPPCPACTQCFDDDDLKLLERAQQATQR